MQAKLPPSLFLVLLSVFIIAFTASFVSQVHATSTASITVTSFPSTGSGYVTVDGYAIATPAIFAWNVGDNHTIAANSPVTVVPDQSRYVYSGWSDGGGQSHAIIVPSQAATYTVSFQLQYYLSVSGGNGISYSNPQLGNWYDSGASTTVSTEWSDYASNSSGTVLWLPMDEGSGTTARDFSGNGNNGQVYNGTSVAGRYGNALSFNGIDNYVQVPDSSSLHITTALTITAWIKTTGSGMTFRNRIVDKWGSNNQGGGWNLNIWDSSGKLGFEQRYWNGSQMFGTGLQGNTVVTDNAWHFVCATLDSGTATAKLYVDGRLDAQSTSFTNPLLSNNENLAIGAFSVSNYNLFNGITDEVQIYNRALSAAEINADYNNYLGQNRTTVTAWELDGVGLGPARQGSGTLTTPPINMSTYHSVAFASTVQYYLAVKGGNSVSFGIASLTGDQWYDSGTSTTVSTDWVWDAIADKSRTAVNNWQLDGMSQNPTRQNTGTLTTSSIIMSTYHTVTFVSTTQYYLTVNGGYSVSYGTASPTSDNWYDIGTSTTVSTDWVWDAIADKSRTAVNNWQLDGVGLGPARQGSGTLTTPPINMSTYHTLDFVSGTQYCLTVSGGFDVVPSQASPTGDSFYDVGSTLMVTTDYTWGVTNGNTRQNLFSYTLDGATTNVTRRDTGNFSSPVITLKSPHQLTFNSVSQYLVSFQLMDSSGSEDITPSSFQIEINDLGATSVPELEMWLDDGTEFQIQAIIWQNADVKPTNQRLYVVNAPLDEAILDRVFDAKLAVTDYLGIPVSGARVTFTLTNGTTIQSTTGSDGILRLGLIPIGTFHATISYLGTTTEVNSDASIQPAITVKVFASYPTFSLIGGGITIAAVGSVLARWYRRSPALQSRFKTYVRVNLGVPFIMGFMLLLIVAAVSLSMSLSSLANTLAVYAFYALVVGIVLQLVCFMKYGEKGRDKD
jgi:hypothetical protein